MGAIASGGVVVLNKQVLRALRVADEVLQAAIAQQREELLRRERLYRDHRPPQEIRGRIAILVDDGVATGASMKAAIEGLQREPAQVVVAVPVASATAEKNLGLLVDDFICLATPEPFFGVGQWYDDFRQLGDDEVRLACWSVRTAIHSHTKGEHHENIDAAGRGPHPGRQGRLGRHVPRARGCPGRGGLRPRQRQQSPQPAQSFRGRGAQRRETGFISTSCRDMPRGGEGSRGFQATS